LEPLTSGKLWSPWEPGLLSSIIYGFFVLLLVAILLSISG
jgi:hypothetical protein